MEFIMNRILALLLLGALALPAGAQDAVPDNPLLKDRFYFGVGAFFPKTSTQAQANSSVGVGTNIDFENALGMQTSKTVPSAFGRMRFGERWRVEAEWFRLDRSGSRSIDREITWEGTVYPVNAALSSRFDFSDLRVSAGYSFFKTRDKELGVGFGLHVAAYDVSLSNNAIGTEQEDVTAPLPVLSLYGQFALTDRWVVGGRLDRFRLKYEKYDGSLTAIGLDLTYQFSRHLGVGVAYRNLFIDLEVEGDRGLFKFDQSFQGPMLFLSASF
jgi:hypothetical protein